MYTMICDRVVLRYLRNLRAAFHTLWPLLAFMVIGIPSAAFSQQNEPPPNDADVGRLSYLQDSVLIQRGDDDQWYDAALNTPVQTGDRLYVNEYGRAELEFDGNFYRLNSQSGFDILNLSPSQAQVSLYTGTLTVYLRYPPVHPLEIDAPDASVTLSKPGLYRIDAYDAGGMKMTVWQGEAAVYNGTTVPVYAGQQIVVNDNNYDMTAADSPDLWDQWNTDRNQHLEKAEQSRHYISENQDIAGIEDLDYNGQWSNIPEYGWVWTPAATPAGWAPYREGRWVWRDPYGWTWVSYEPWGWAPYHYGRWVAYERRWYWTPGAYRRYSPALVGFVSSNGGLYIGWVPLAPRDEFIPWWGAPRPRPGATIVYYNQSYGGSVTITTTAGFANGVVRHREIVARRGFQIVNSRPITVVNVVPTRNSLAPRRGRIVVVDRNLTRTFDRRIVVRNNEIPVVRPFSEKIVEIKQHKGIPVADIRRDDRGSMVYHDASIGNNRTQPSRASVTNRPPVLVRQPGLGNSVGGRPVAKPPETRTNVPEPEKRVTPGKDSRRVQPQPSPQTPPAQPRVQQRQKPPVQPKQIPSVTRQRKPFTGQPKVSPPENKVRKSVPEKQIRQPQKPERKTNPQPRKDERKDKPDRG